MATSRPLILILGTSKDEHVVRVSSELVAHSGVEVVVLDFVAGTSCAVEMDENGSWTLHVAGRLMSGPYLVWDRVKFLVGTELYPQGDRVSSDHAMNEWRALYDTVCGLSEGRVVNELGARLHLKPQQRAIAAGVGFLVPPSLVTSSKSAISAFQARRGKTIVKSLSAQRVLAEELGGRQYNLLTMRASADDVRRADASQFSFCPHFFQSEIAKAYELRIVWVGTHAIAFRIHSQERALTQLDWRNGIRSVRYERVEIESALEQCLRDFMQAINLFSGSVDLVVDRRDRTWFLEVNQIGQWGWLDDLAEGAIAKLFAQELEARALELLTGPPVAIPIY